MDAPRPSPLRLVSRPIAWWARTVFTLDLRSLALFRVVLSLTLICDLGSRMTDLSAHYTDEGTVPRSTLAELGIRPAWPSVHMLGGSAAFQATLFVIQIGFAVGMLVGWRTPLMAFASWALLLSLHTRNTTVLHGGDVLERIILFWSIFLPMGARYSLDARAGRGASAADDQRVFTAGTAALLLQVGCVYFFSVFLKHGDVWRKDGTAVFYALSLDQFRTPFGDWVYQFPAAMKVLTFASLGLEFFGPLGLLVPVWNGPIRTLVVLSYLGFHAGLGLCMELGNFPWVCAAMWLALLPTWFWEKVAGPAATPAADAPARPDRVGYVETALVSVLIVYVVLCNYRSVDKELGSKLLPDAANRIGESFQIVQAWNMFAPQPSRTNARYTVAALVPNHPDGPFLDIWHGRPFSDAPPLPPDRVTNSYRNSRWRRYLMSLYEDGWKGFRPAFADYMRREWEKAHPNQPIARWKDDPNQPVLKVIVFGTVVDAAKPPDQWQRTRWVLWKPPDLSDEVNPAAYLRKP